MVYYHALQKRDAFLNQAFSMVDYRLLQGKSAIVTGSGRGIGRSIAKLFAEHGASVVINDIDADVAQATSNEINDAGGKAAVCAGSVTDPEFPARLVKTCAESFGGIDIIVNNAGYTWDSVVQNITDEQWYAMIDVHLTAPFRIIRAATPYMRRSRQARDSRRQARPPEDYQRVIDLRRRRERRSDQLLSRQDGNRRRDQNDGEGVGTL